MNTDKIKHNLAEYAHEAWSEWMEYLFSKCARTPNGNPIIPLELYERWKRQIATKYEYLPEDEKKSDLDEAEKIWDIVMRQVLIEVLNEVRK